MKLFKLTVLMLFMAMTVAAEPLERINLKAWYDGYNEDFFLNHLPKASVRYHETDDTTMGYTFNDEDGFNIVISPALNPTPGETKLTLLHEMCHVATYHDWDLDAHGPRWKDCMHRLANEGAFDLLW